MTKPMKYLKLAQLLRKAGFQSRPGRGDHEIWTGPNNARAVLVRDTECSPGVTRQALNAIQKAKEN